jgi:hypothetical protein
MTISKHDDQRSLLPYDDDYVLIHKRTLLVNTATNSQLSEIIAEKSGMTADQISVIVAAPICEFFATKTDKEISDCVAQLLADSIKNNNKKMLTKTQFPLG